MGIQPKLIVILKLVLFLLQMKFCLVTIQLMFFPLLIVVCLTFKHHPLHFKVLQLYG